MRQAGYAVRCATLVAALLALVLVAGAQGATGSLDRSFGSDGVVRSSSLGPVLGLVVQPDGKIVTVGLSLTGDGFSVTRYAPDGSLDPTFGSGGHVSTSFGGGSGDVSAAVALQSDGKLVVVGKTVGSSTAMALARYNPDGSLDASFGAGGKVVTLLLRDEVATAVVIQPDGKLVVVGFRMSGTGGPDMIVVRYSADGSIDPAFANGTLHTLDFGASDIAFGVAIQTDGKVVVLGTSFGATSSIALARYNGDGTIDAGFGTGGKTTTAFGGNNTVGIALGLQPDGKIVVDGTVRSPAGSPAFAVARYNGDGSLDGSFGTGGEVTTDFGGKGAQGQALALQPDGKILAAGSTGTPGNFALARYTAAGSLDPTFAGGGTVSVDLGGLDLAAAVGIQPADGRIVLAGGTGSTAALARVIGDTSDVSAPVVSVPESLSLAATSAAGAVASFDVSATDPDDAASTPVCSPTSGSTFALGVTTVTCTSFDTHGNVGTGVFDVAVSDVTAPSVSLPPPIALDATSAAGASITFAATASDPDDAAGAPVCSPVSGSTFPIGVTTVTCASFDTHGNEGSASFGVSVRPVANADRYTVRSGGVLVVAAPGVTGNDLVAPPASALVSRSPSSGTLVLGSDGSLTYTPNKNFVGTDSFAYVASSASLTSAPATVTLSVTGPGADCNLSDYPQGKGGVLNLKGANLGGCYLVGVDLSGATLTNANLRGADLAGATLTGAKLSTANLAGADLSGASLLGASLSGATLTGVTWSSTICPDGTLSDANGGTCLGHLG